MNGQNPFNIALLNTGVTYFVCDALYLNRIKSRRDILEMSNWVERIEKEVFPYAYFPFTQVRLSNPDNKITKVEIDARNISAVPEEELHNIGIEEHPFCTDTGIIIFVNANILGDFLNDYDYEKLTDSQTDLCDLPYWNKLINKFGPGDVALLASLSEQSGYDFCGSGMYKITF